MGPAGIGLVVVVVVVVGGAGDAGAGDGADGDAGGAGGEMDGPQRFGMSPAGLVGAAHRPAAGSNQCCCKVEQQESGTAGGCRL